MSGIALEHIAADMHHCVSTMPSTRLNGFLFEFAGALISIPSRSFSHRLRRSTIRSGRRNAAQSQADNIEDPVNWRAQSGLPGQSCSLDQCNAAVRASQPLTVATGLVESRHTIVCGPTPDNRLDV